MKTENVNFVIVHSYIKPGDDETLLTFHNVLSELVSQNCDSPILIFGDLNARIGSANQIDDNIMLNEKIYSSRISLDSIENPRGRKLVKDLEDLEFLILNGRSLGDRPAQFTFCGPNGRSVIDLGCVNYHAMQLVDDFRVVTDINLSDHFLIETKLKFPFVDDTFIQNIQKPSVFKFFWDMQKKEQFVNAMAEIDTEMAFTGEIERDNNFLLETITIKAKQLELAKKITNF